MEPGARAFAEGDRLYFLRNERGLGVKNGTLGTLEGIDDAAEEDARLAVRLDDGRRTGKNSRNSFPGQERSSRCGK